MPTGLVEQPGPAAALPGAVAGGGDRGDAPAAVTGDLAITVRGVADKPVWDGGHTSQHYDTSEDSSGIKLNVKAGLTDTDGSETLTYQIKWEAGKGTLMLNGAELKPNGSGLYMSGRQHQQGDRGSGQGFQRRHQAVGDPDQHGEDPGGPGAGDGAGRED
jgi:hypothetical protein